MRLTASVTVLHVVESSGNRVTWSYDKTYQLRNEQRSGSNSYNVTYTYDPVGNRLVLLNGGVPTTSTYDSANELSTSQAFSVGITTYTSDAAGNLLTSLSPSNQRTTNTWDFENRLTQVALPSAIVDTFTYNGDGQRVQKIDSTGTTNHVWDGQNILLETNGSNIIQVVYTLQPMLYGNLISQWRSGTASFYLFDGLGSTIQLANATGTVTDSYLYDSFGNALLASGSTTNPFRYAGQVGYYVGVDVVPYYVRARYYDPQTGRFFARDPLGFAGGDSNLYRYAFNRPIDFIDPSGTRISCYGLSSYLGIILAGSASYLKCSDNCGNPPMYMACAGLGGGGGASIGTSGTFGSGCLCPGITKQVNVEGGLGFWSLGGTYGTTGTVSAGGGGRIWRWCR